MMDAFVGIGVITLSIALLAVAQYARRKEYELMMSDMKRWHAAETEKKAREIDRLKNLIDEAEAELERSRAMVTMLNKEGQHLRMRIADDGKTADELETALDVIKKLRDQITRIEESKKATDRYLEDHLRVIPDQAKCAMEQLR
jgi:predicted transcriptional regulator